MLPKSSSVRTAVTTSSTAPRLSRAPLRMEKLMVSPVPKAAAIITALSIDPTMMSTVWPLRLGMLRSPSLSMTLLRQAMISTTAMMAQKMANMTIIRVSIDNPNISSIGQESMESALGLSIEIPMKEQRIAGPVALFHGMAAWRTVVRLTICGV